MLCKFDYWYCRFESFTFSFITFYFTSLLDHILSFIVILFILDVYLEDAKKSQAKDKATAGAAIGKSTDNSKDIEKSGGSKPCKDASSADLVTDLRGYETDFSASTIEEDNSDNDSIDSYLQDMGLDAWFNHKPCLLIYRS